MKIGSVDIATVLKSRKTRRTGLMIAFYAVLALLLYSIVASYLVESDPHLSAYDDDWDDLSAFRADLKGMGVDTTSMISSPVLLGEIENPEDTVFIVTGVEQDTISLPRFTGDVDVIQFSESEGYTTTEINAITEYVFSGGTLLVMDDFGYSAGLADNFELGYSGHQLYDEEAWARGLDYNYVWMNASNPYDYTGTDTSGSHPCYSDADNDGIIDRLDSLPNSPVNGADTPSVSEAGLCAHHIETDSTGGQFWNFSTNYNVLLNTPSAFDKDAAESNSDNIYAWGRSTQDSYLDTNDDGQGDVGFEGGGIESDEQGPFTMAIKVCEKRDCAEDTGVPMGRAIFVSDGSALMNAIYDWEETNDGTYGDLNGKVMPNNDNRRWVLDIIAESLLMHTADDNGTSAAGKQVIFDESRHQQGNAMGDTYNLIYYILVYFTNDWMAMLFLFLALFIAFEAVIIKKVDPEPWRHVFSIIYYGFGDARRYGYYAKSNKIKQVFLSRVRNNNGLTREEFDAMPASDLQQMINDPVLVKFVFENRDYSLEQMVTIVKRIKVWGKT